MKPVQLLIATLMLFAITIFIALPFAVFAAVGSPLLLGLWTVFSLAFIALILKYSVLIMKAGKMVVVSCFGNIYGLYSPQLSGKNGTLDSGILITPPFMVKRQILPTGAFIVALQSSTANTKNADEDPTVEMRVIAHIQVRLKQNRRSLERLIHLMPGAGDRRDFTHGSHQDTYDLKDDGFTVKIVPEACLAIVKFLATLLQAPFNEVAGQTIPEFTLQECLKDKPAIQKRMLDILDTKGTVFSDQEVRDCFQEFDITVIAISPTSEAVAKAIAARSIAVRQGKANIAEAEAKSTVRGIAAIAEANAITTVAASLNKDGGKLVLAAETIGKMPNVQLITGMSPVDAGMSLLAANGGKQQPPAAPPTPTT